MGWVFQKGGIDYSPPTEHSFILSQHQSPFLSWFYILSHAEKYFSKIFYSFRESGGMFFGDKIEVERLKHEVGQGFIR